MNRRDALDKLRADVKQWSAAYDDPVRSSWTVDEKKGEVKLTCKAPNGDKHTDTYKFTTK